MRQHEELRSSTVLGQLACGRRSEKWTCSAGQMASTLVAIVLVILCVVSDVTAQSSSLLRQDLPVTGKGPLLLDQASWMYQQLPPAQEIREQDIVTIRVDIKSQMFSDGEVERRKNALYDLRLTDWITLDGLKQIKPARMEDGDPRIRGQLDQQYRAQAEMETRESLKFDIAAKVVDIRPNGDLVLEAHQLIRINEEQWDYALTGVCSRQAIGPGFVVLSKDVAELQISKRERGVVNDGYRRGWFTRWLDTLHAF